MRELPEHLTDYTDDELDGEIKFYETHTKSDDAPFLVAQVLYLQEKVRRLTS